MKYPAECPLFRWAGEIFEGRPEWDETTDGLGDRIALVRSGDDDSLAVRLIAQYDGVEPLTPSAVTLLKWSGHYLWRDDNSSSQTSKETK